MKQCGDGSWCCYNLDSGDNGDECCAAGHGVFLNDNGVAVDTPSSSSSVSLEATSTSSTATNSSTKIPTTNASSTPTSNNDSGLSTGATIGLGVGVGLGVLILGASGVIVWLLMRRRNNRTDQTKEASSVQRLSPHDDVRYHYANQTCTGYNSPAIPEAPGSAFTEMHGDATRFEADGNAVSLQELPADDRSDGNKYK